MWAGHETVPSSGEGVAWERDYVIVHMYMYQVAESKMSVQPYFHEPQASENTA